MKSEITRQKLVINKMTEPDAWKTDAIFHHAVCAHSKTVHPLPEVEEDEIDPLFSDSTIQEAVENRIEYINNSKTETKFEEEAKNIAIHNFKQLLEELGIINRKITINGTRLEEILEETKQKGGEYE